MEAGALDSHLELEPLTPNVGAKTSNKTCSGVCQTLEGMCYGQWLKPKLISLLGVTIVPLRFAFV